MSKAIPFLPYGRQTIDEEDLAAVRSAMEADYLTTGPTVDAFEAAFAAATGAKHAVACSSGTAALHLAVDALGLGPGDCVVVPTMTFLSTANAVRMTGAEVIFADVDGDTGLMTPATLEAALARAGSLAVKAAIPVHLNGALCDMPALAAIAGRRGLSLIEDACHALGLPNIGATPHSALACFSTHPVKAMTTAEGGVVTTARPELARRMRSFRSHGMTREPAAFKNKALAFDNGEPNPWYYEMPAIGWNYRIPDVLCALGLTQLRKLDGFWRRRRAIVALYDQLMAPLAPRLKPVHTSAAVHGWHLYAVLIDFTRLGRSRRSVMAGLREAGIGTQVHYIPVHRQPYYVRRYGNLDLTGADAYYERCLSIPMFPGMSDEDVAHVASNLAKLVNG